MQPLECGRTARHIHRVGYLALDVTDLARAREFYVRCCNLVPVDERPGQAMLRCRFEHHCLVLREAPAAGLRHLGLETGDDAETAAVWEQVRQLGAPVRAAPDLAGRRGEAFQFQDPDGNWIEVYRCLERLAAPASPGPFVLTKLAHFGLVSTDMTALAGFYRRLGLRVSDWTRRGIFLRCDRDHHGLGFLPGRRPGLHHHAYEVADWDQIKSLLDWFFRQDAVPLAGPVRHGAGNNLAVYVRDPDAQLVEFCCEVERIDDEEDHRREYFPAFDLWLRQELPPGFLD